MENPFVPLEQPLNPPIHRRHDDLEEKHWGSGFEGDIRNLHGDYEDDCESSYGVVYANF